MAEMLKVAIIDNNSAVTKDLSTHFTKTGMFDIVCTAGDGDSALDALSDKDIDILVIDMVLPNRDGMYVMEALTQRKGQKPMMVAFSSFVVDHWAKKINDIGAAFIQKPFNYELMVKRVMGWWTERKHAESIMQSSGDMEFSLELTPPTPISIKPSTRNKPPTKKNDINPKKFIDNLFNRMGVPHSLSGRVYLQTAFLTVIEKINNPLSIQGDLLNRIYPTVARAYGKSPAAVERGIRYLISCIAKKKYMHDVFRQVGIVGVEMGEKMTICEMLTSLVYCYKQECGIE